MPVLDMHHETYTVQLTTGSVAVDTPFMVIDLSDNNTWTHANTGYVILDYILLEVNPDASFLGSISIGFLSNAGTEDSDFHQILELDMQKKSDILTEQLFFGTHGLKCLDSTHYGPITTNSTHFQTDVAIAGPNGTTHTPGNGDLVMLVTRSAGSCEVALTLGYETKR